MVATELVSSVFTGNGRMWEVTIIHAFGTHTVQGKNRSSALAQARREVRSIIARRRLFKGDLF
jgi:hypothetical protein